MSPLPVRLVPRPGQALDSYLEHLADANQLSTAQLMNHLRASSSAPTRYLALAPDPAVLATIAGLAGLRREDLSGTVLTMLPGVAALDPGSRYGHRDLAAKGWVQLHGTQACPACLADHGAWATTWRLPVVTTCTPHARHLAITCPGCRRPFRDSRHNHLRPVGSDTLCGNPLGAGPRQHCTRDLTTIPTPVAAPEHLERQARTDTALAGQPVPVLGALSDSADYLADLRHLTVLLLHLACQPNTDNLADWAPAVRREAADRTLQRGPRWGIRPPPEPSLRARALTAADQVLTLADRDSAADALTPWLAAVPTGTDSRLGWIADRTVMTPALTSLVTAALAPYRRISHQLAAHTGGSMTHARPIPQVLPPDIFAKHLAADLTVTALVGRTYASICLARTLPGIHTWAEAAQALNLPWWLGIRTAKTCSARLRVANPTFVEHLLQVQEDLDVDVDYRKLEHHIATRVVELGWATEQADHATGAAATIARRHACTWVWTHHGHAHPETAPGWGNQPRAGKAWAAYTRYEKSLTRQQQRTLTDQFIAAGAAR